MMITNPFKCDELEYNCSKFLVNFLILSNSNIASLVHLISKPESVLDPRGAPSLLDHDIDFVAVFHLKSFRTIVVLDALSIEDESTLVVGQSLPLAVCVH